MRICVSQRKHIQSGEKGAWLSFLYYLIDDDDGGGQVVLPGHVAVAVEGVGDEVERGEGGQLVEGSGSHTTDLIPKQAQALQVVQALWKIFF